ncbi:MAG: DUF4381 domain-containing protein [Acidobacteriota bacterium]|nr:DUF4381 domain-containing protein [Acidobacteriota bacterium]
MGDDFGNYLIRGIDEIIIPEPVSWMPSAPGWRVLGVLLLLAGLYALVRGIQKWRRNRYRRETLHRLQAALQVSKQAALKELPFLLKACALRVYPRQRIAALSGLQWCAFLDRSYKGPSFEKNGLLPLLAYAPPEQWQGNADELLTMARLWIKTHRENADV